VSAAELGPAPAAAPRPSPGRLRRALAGVGRGTRRRTRFLLLLSSLAFGVLRDAARPSQWRRTVRAEFRRVLRQSVGGGLAPVLVTAVLIGLAMVS
jgi:hypothetical protein